MKSSTIAKTLAIAAVTTIALGIAPKTKAEDKRRSEAALKGTFAYTSTGFIITAPVSSIVGPSAEVGTQTFDGKGDVTFNSVRAKTATRVQGPQRANIP